MELKDWIPLAAGVAGWALAQVSSQFKERSRRRYNLGEALVVLHIIWAQYCIVTTTLEVIGAKAGNAPELELERLNLTRGTLCANDELAALRECARKLSMTSPHSAVQVYGLAMITSRLIAADYQSVAGNAGQYSILFNTELKNANDGLKICERLAGRIAWQRSPVEFVKTKWIFFGMRRRQAAARGFMEDTAQRFSNARSTVNRAPPSDPQA